MAGCTVAFYFFLDRERERDTIHYKPTTFVKKRLSEGLAGQNQLSAFLLSSHLFLSLLFLSLFLFIYLFLYFSIFTSHSYSEIINNKKKNMFLTFPSPHLSLYIYIYTHTTQKFFYFLFL